MPIYDYQCTSCGFKKEVMRKISEPNLTACPECGKETFTKQLSAPSFQLTGSGWYATDFKNSGAKKTEAKPGSESGPKSEPKSESTSGSQSESGSTETKAESKEASASAAPCATGCACH
jgi:putative FmdB family regulatory protein